MTTFRVTVETRDGDGPWEHQDCVYLSDGEALILALTIAGYDVAALARRPPEEQARVIERVGAGADLRPPGMLN